MILAMQDEPTDLKCFLVSFSHGSWRTLMIAVMTCYDILRHCIHQHSGRLYVVLFARGADVGFVHQCWSNNKRLAKT